jgi:hypothetical protein
LSACGVVNEIQIPVAADRIAGFVDCLAGRLQPVIGVVDLAGEEDLGAIETRCFDGSANLGLVSIELYLRWVSYEKQCSALCSLALTRAELLQTSGTFCQLACAGACSYRSH